MAGRRRQQASTKDPEYEVRMELAVKQLRDGTHKTINAIATAHQVSDFSTTHDP
ncbi:hypothetical protein OG21DRAFT_1511522 [Imleria badia]|nr:hypothetical protein OG21DRAFT_1511522 [Imleria badia]